MKQLFRYFLVLVLITSGSAYGQYCSTNMSNYYNDGIGRVVLGDIDNNSGITSDYSDFTAQSTTLNPGQTYTLSITQGGAYATNYFTVYIDFDNDQSFSSGEQLSVISLGRNEVGEIEFTVPQNTFSNNTTTRLRVIGMDNSSELDACASNSISYYGEVEDYSVVITPSAQLPVASFSFSSDSAASFSEVSVNNNSSEADTYLWSIEPQSSFTYASGDSSSESPVFEFHSEGTFVATLIASNADGSDTTKDSIVIYSVLPAAAFNTTRENYNVGEKATISNASTGGAESFLWRFSPSTVTYHEETDSTSVNPIISFDASGSYSVTLIATNDVGSDTLIAADYFLVKLLPVADFTYSDSVVKEGDTIQLTSTSLNADEYEWNFDPASVTFVDGFSNADASTSVIFDEEGVYTVLLTATNDEGTDVEIKTDVITVFPDVKPSASFLVSDSTPTVGYDTVTLTDNSGNLPTSWAWSIEPGDYTVVGGAMNEQSVQIVFNEIGGYEISLIATNDNGFDVIQQENAVIVQDIPRPEAKFTVSDTTPRPGDTVQFTDLSTENPSSWTWTISPTTFDYAGNDDQNTQNPRVIFNEEGSYSVTLTVNNGFSTDFELKQEYVFVDSTNTSNDSDGDDDTVDNGGGDNDGDDTGDNGGDTVPVLDTTVTCAAALDLYMLGAYVQPENESDFDLAVEDLDNEDLNAGVFGEGRKNGWALSYNVPSPGDTNYFWYASSYFNDQDASDADDWLIMGPITLGDAGGELSWTHRFAAASGRNSYEVLVGTTGRTSSDFAGATAVYSIEANDATTEGDTTNFHTKTASLEGFAGEDIYVAFHHTGKNMFVVELDDIKISSCQMVIDTVDNDDNSDDDNGDDSSEFVASFTSSVTSIVEGETVSFTNTSTGTVAAYLWNISPSTGFTYLNGTNSSSEDIFLQFNTAGTYTVVLMISDGAGGVETSESTTIVVNSGNDSGDDSGDDDGDDDGDDSGDDDSDDGTTQEPSLTALFVADNTTPSTSDIVIFTNNSLNATSYSWSFTPNTVTYQDGTDANSQEPKITFEPGVYKVSLIASDGSNADTLVRSNYILVGEQLASSFESDFSNASDWDISSGWVISTNGPVGQYSSGMGSIASTTAGNGFAMFDSDNEGGGEHTMTMADAIDLTGIQNTAVSFQWYYRAYNDNLYLEYSTDGSTWNEVAKLSDGYSNNAFTSNPKAEMISVASLVDGQASVKFRFKYVSEQGGYAVMVDDFKVLEQPANDLEAKTGFASYVSSTYQGATPISQVEAISFAGSVYNNGTSNQNNVILSAEVLDADGDLLFSTSSAGNTVEVGSTDTIAANETFTPEAKGLYTATYYFGQNETDANPTNNKTADVLFQITDTVFSRAFSAGGLYGSNPLGGAGSQFAANYTLVNEAKVTTTSILLSSYTTEGTVIRGVLYSWDVSNNSRTEIATTSEFTVPAMSEASMKVTLPLTGNNNTISAGNYSMAWEVVSVPENGDFVLYMDNASPIYLPAASSVYVSASGSQGWYTFSQTPHIYLHIEAPVSDDDQADNGDDNDSDDSDDSDDGNNGGNDSDDDDDVVTSIETKDAFGVGVYPNPATDYLQVKLTANDYQNAQLLLVNNVGQIIKIIQVESVSEQLINIDLQGMIPGIYTVQFVAQDERFQHVTKVIVK